MLVVVEHSSFQVPTAPRAKFALLRIIVADFVNELFLCIFHRFLEFIFRFSTLFRTEIVVTTVLVEEVSDTLSWNLPRMRSHEEAAYGGVFRLKMEHFNQWL